MPSESLETRRTAPSNPVEYMGSAARPLFLLTFVGTMLMMWWLNHHGAPLQTPAAPYGIISYELTWTKQNCNDLLYSWGEYQRQIAKTNIWCDFLFLPLYSTFLALGCGFCAKPTRNRNLRTAFLLIAFSQWIAAALDCIENTCLLLLLYLGEATSHTLPLLSSAAATLKFAIIIAGILVLLMTIVIWLWRKATRSI